MHWMTMKDGLFAYGHEHGYLVVTGPTGARLSRFPVRPAAAGLLAVVAKEATRTTIILPLGRGPGRPGGEPELAVLVETAKSYAEHYEEGGGLPGYPAWKRDGDLADAGRCPGPGGCFPDEPCDSRENDCAPR